jgi:ribosomal-protein-alanine N-acetyltransferase
MPIGPKLSCEGWILRPLVDSDVTSTYRDWLNDGEVNRYLETRYAEQTLESVSAFVSARNRSDDEYLFGIFEQHSETHVGNIKLGPERRPHRLAEVSLFIGEKSYWGSGLATIAIRCITTFGFDALRLNKLVASMYIANRASTRAFLKAGWKRECELHDHYIHDGKPMGLVMVGITATDYKQQRSRE